jgi:cysteine desulfurase
MALKGFSAAHEGSRIVTSTVEHPAVRNTARYLQSKGTSLVELDVDSSGNIRMDQFENLNIDNRTLVSLMWANNETGVLFPIHELAEKVKEKGGFFHTDAVQAAGKVPIDVKTVPVDMLVISGHKLHAPKGIGAIFIRKGVDLEPILHGGHQKRVCVPEQKMFRI